MLMRIASGLSRDGSSAEAVAKLGWAWLAADHEFDRQKEHFWAIGLNTKLKVVYVDLVSLGVLDASLVHAREVYRMAIAKGVSRLLVMHNHPSGDLSVSEHDRVTTDKLIQAGEIIGIALVDHVIIGNDTNKYCTFRSNWTVLSTDG